MMNLKSNSATKRSDGAPTESELCGLKTRSEAYAVHAIACTTARGKYRKKEYAAHLLWVIDIYDYDSEVEC